jgi:hypothetical protein
LQVPSFASFQICFLCMDGGLILGYARSEFFR